MKKQWPSPKNFGKFLELMAEKYNYACFIAGKELTFGEFIRTYSKGDGFIYRKNKKDKHTCCDGECNHDDCCGKVEANCPLSELKEKK